MIEATIAIILINEYINLVAYQLFVANQGSTSFAYLIYLVISLPIIAS